MKYQRNADHSPTLPFGEFAKKNSTVRRKVLTFIKK